jgi:hypothetical protein
VKPPSPQALQHSLQAVDWTLAVGPPIVAWRVWRISEDGGELMLRSVYQHQVTWPSGEPLQAACNCMGVLDGHDAPGLGPGRECGIYAVRDEELTRRWSWFTRVPTVATVGKAFGRVRLWGRVVQYEQGYKAEFAYPADLYLLDVDPEWDPAEVQAELADRYRVPIPQFDRPS